MPLKKRKKVNLVFRRNMEKLLPLVLGQVETERQLQDIQWGGASHDDTHVQNDWTEQIQRQLNFAINEQSDFRKWRSRLIKIAALAIAGCESQDRIHFKQISSVNTTFEDWFKSLKMIGIIYGAVNEDCIPAEEHWRQHYDDGLSPLEAILEEFYEGC